MTPRPDDRQLTIGEFAHLSGLTAKALRLYDEQGLLAPADIDRWTGYRRYDRNQVDRARLIGLLRGVDMRLADIAALLDARDAEPEAAVERLASHLAQIEHQHASRRRLAQHITTVLRQESSPMFTIQTRHVPAQRVMSVQRRLHAAETDTFIAETKAAFRAHLVDDAPIGPFIVIFHGMVTDESDGPIEIIQGCPNHTQPSDQIGIRTEPAHDEAYTSITKEQWDYPAILGAYDAVACSPEATARPASRLSCREVYTVEPDDVGPNDIVCDVAFPLG